MGIIFQLWLAILVVHIVDIPMAEIQKHLRWRKLKESALAMTRKDYETIAAVLKSFNHLQKKIVKSVTDALVEQLQKENPAFDKKRFLEAAGFIK